MDLHTYFTIAETTIVILAGVVVVELFFLKRKYLRGIKINERDFKEYKRGTEELKLLKEEIEKIQSDAKSISRELEIYTERANLLNKENVSLREKSERYRERLIDLGIKNIN